MTFEVLIADLPSVIKEALACLQRVGVLALVVSSGCATIGYTEPRHEDVPIRDVRQEVPTEGAVGEVHQDGTVISVTASHVCEVRQDHLVRRTSTSEAENRSAPLDWLLTGVGVASIGTGAVLLADAGNTYANDKTSRTYNPVGFGTERAYGIGMLAVGAALLAIPVIDVIRAQETKVETGNVQLDGEVIERGVACANRPLAKTPVYVVLGEREIELGETGPKGTLTADLDQAIDGELRLPANRELSVVANGSAIGTIAIDPVRVVREGRAWKSVNVGHCRTAEQADACESVQRFLASYPDGAHAAEAQQLLAETRPKLLMMADDQHWASVNVQACTQQEFEWGNEVRAACKPVSDYLSAFPDGRHAKEARAALQKGQQRADAIDRAREQRDKADERREAQQERKRCIGLCKVVCSQLRYSADPQGCFEGCVAQQGCGQ